MLFFLSVIPPKEQFGFDNQEFYQDKLKSFCEQNGILFLNPYDQFKQKGFSELYLDWDPHFTKEGHRVYGEFVYNKVKPHLKK